MYLLCTAIFIIMYTARAERNSRTFCYSAARGVVPSCAQVLLQSSLSYKPERLSMSKHNYVVVEKFHISRPCQGIVGLSIATIKRIILFCSHWRMDLLLYFDSCCLVQYPVLHLRISVIVGTMCMNYVPYFECFHLANKINELLLMRRRLQFLHRDRSTLNYFFKKKTETARIEKTIKKEPLVEQMDHCRLAADSLSILHRMHPLRGYQPARA